MAAIIDSQSVKMAGQPGERGYHVGKKVDGHKRHMLVDTLELILRVVVHRADIQDRDGAKLLLERVRWSVGIGSSGLMAATLANFGIGWLQRA
jgi:putative transposase